MAESLEFYHDWSRPGLSPVATRVLRGWTGRREMARWRYRAVLCCAAWTRRAWAGSMTGEVETAWIGEDTIRVRLAGRWDRNQVRSGSGSGSGSGRGCKFAREAG